MTLKEHFLAAENGRGKLTEEFTRRLTGLSSPKIWRLMSSLGSEAKNYLEIGTYMGSTLMATLEGNGHLNAYAIDNFCMKPHTRNHFFQNVKGLRFNFIEKDCFQVQKEDLPAPIDLYFYDGRHEYQDQYDAITHFLPMMDDEFIYVCDDWNNAPVREATFTAIEDNGLQIIEGVHRLNGKMKDAAGWWCGIAAFKLRQV